MTCEFENLPYFIIRISWPYCAEENWYVNKRRPESQKLLDYQTFPCCVFKLALLIATAAAVFESCSPSVLSVNPLESEVQIMDKLGLSSCQFRFGNDHNFLFSHSYTLTFEVVICLELDTHKYLYGYNI